MRLLMVSMTPAPYWHRPPNLGLHVAVADLVNLVKGKGKLPGVYVDARHAHEFPELVEAPRRKARARPLGRETISWFLPFPGNMPRPFKSVLLRLQTPGGSVVEGSLWSGAEWLSATGQPVKARVIEWAYQPRGSVG